MKRTDDLSSWPISPNQKAECFVTKVTPRDVPATQGFSGLFSTLSMAFTSTHDGLQKGESRAKFYGTKGWIFVTRDEMTTPSDPGMPQAKIQPLMASDPKILDSVIGPNEIHLYKSDDQHGNCLECVRSRQQPIAPVEIGHRACSTCLLHHIAMKTRRKLYWDPEKERFKNDNEANALLSRPQRAPYKFS